MDKLPLSFRPASWYFRRALRESQTIDGAIEIGHLLVDEVELLKAQIREMGGIPRRMVNPRRVGPDAQVIEDERQLPLRFG